VTSSVPWALITGAGSGIGAAMADALANVTTSAGPKIVFAQDVPGPLPPSLLSNRADHRASLQRRSDLAADVLSEGRYGIYRGKQEIIRLVHSVMPPGHT
jgi:NAD(P)-dependent dehydrogenase (short-subunit alcohol dehydrogenase family)